MKSDVSLRVLIVEDELLIRWALTQALSDRGHRVVTADTAAAAFNALRAAEAPMDVVLLDLRLPDSGREDLDVLAAMLVEAYESNVH